ncbi:MAG: molybdopterin molybdotransferase MoeA [Deltaproteobacteria bacterium]|nr:molybdopterin molybdotransferase MoeA [Deltaproteobacteria bacterium]
MTPENLLPFSQALRQVLDHTALLPRVEEVPLAEALGRFLAEDVKARENIPVADNSAMDGYALRAEDGGEPLRVREVLGAEQVAAAPLEPGEAVKIMTGAPIPPGADAVVMVEHTTVEQGRVRVLKPVKAGANIRRAGEDIRQGETVFLPGERLTPARVGMLASLGIPRVKVRGRPRVGVLPTGNELVGAGEPLKPGRVRDSNSHTLAGLILQAGAEPVVFPVVSDTPEDLKQRMSAALASTDLLLTSGGVSMGDFDFVEPMARELGLTIHFHKLNIKPGKPVVFATGGGRTLFGLPGNPVSVMVGFLQFVRPALWKMAGSPQLGPRVMTLPLAQAFQKNDGKRHFLRGVVSLGPQGLSVRLTGEQGSGMLHSMGRANALVVVEEDRNQVAPGEMVRVELLDGEAWGEP